MEPMKAAVREASRQKARSILGAEDGVHFDDDGDDEAEDKSLSGVREDNGVGGWRQVKYSVASPSVLKSVIVLAPWNLAANVRSQLERFGNMKSTMRCGSLCVRRLPRVQHIRLVLVGNDGTEEQHHRVGREQDSCQHPFASDPKLVQSVVLFARDFLFLPTAVRSRRPHFQQQRGCTLLPSESSVF
jgi:hypothetical protein